MSLNALQIGYSIGKDIGDAQFGAEDRKLAREQARANIDSQLLKNEFTQQQIQSNALTLQTLQQQFDDLQAQRIIDEFNGAGKQIALNNDASNLESLLNDPRKREMLKKYSGLDPFEGLNILPVDDYDQQKLSDFISDVAYMRAMDRFASVGQNVPLDYQLTPEELEEASKSVRLGYDTANNRTQLIDLNTISKFLFPNGYYQGQHELTQQQRRRDAIAAALEARKKVSDINKTDSDREINEAKAPGEIANTNADTLNKQANTKATLDENNRKEMTFAQNQSVTNAINNYNANGDTRDQLKSQSVGDFAAYYRDVPKNSDGSDIVTPLNTAEVNAISLGFGLNSDGTHTKIENPQQLQFYIDRITGGDMKQLPRIYPQLKQMAARAKADGNEPVFNYISDLAKQFDKSATGEIIEKSQEAATVNKNAIYIANSVLSGNMPDGWTQYVGTKFWNDWLTVNGETARAWSQGRVNAENLKFIKAISIGDNKNIASLAKQMDTTTNWNSETHFLEDLLNSLDAVINNSKSIADISPLGQSVNLINENKQTKKAFNDIAIMRNLPLMLQRNPENTAIVQLNGQNLVTLENSFREKLKHQNIIITDGKTVTLYPRQYTDQGENLNKFIYSAKEYKETVEKNHKNSRGIFNRFTDAIGLTQ